MTYQDRLRRKRAGQVKPQPNVVEQQVLKNLEIKEKK